MRNTEVCQPALKSRKRSKILVGCLASLGLLGVEITVSPGAHAQETIVVQWDKVILQQVRDTHPGPPIVARMLAIVHTAMFDAWAAYDQTAVPTRANGIARRPASENTDANKTIAMSYAAYRTSVDLFPSDTAVADAQMALQGLDPSNTSSDTTTPIGIGNIAADAVILFRHDDGANQLGDELDSTGPYSDYNIPGSYTKFQAVNTPDLINDPNQWQPLRVSDGHGGFVIQTYIAPFWANVIPFALKSPLQFPGNGPELYPEGGYIKQAEQLIDYSADLTDEQKVIAEYWKDGPHSELPPGHWALFGQFVSQRDNHTLDDDTKMFFALSNAIFDASVASWAVKRAHTSVRPITAIHFLKTGKPIRSWGGPCQGTRLITGENWLPYQPKTIVTPPFPEYYSGHSIFSAAGAEILESFTGSDNFGDSVTFQPGSSVVEPCTPKQAVTLSWATFSEAADQAGISRRYGGIHFPEGDLDARAAGRLVGAQAWQKALTFFNGTATPQ
jgi:hypothetical protein